MTAAGAPGGRRLVVVGASSHVGGGVLRAGGDLGRAVIAASSRECDLSREETARAFFRSVGAASDEPVDVVMLSAVNRTVGNSFETFDRNVRMARHFAVATSEANVRSVVYVSTVDVYGRAPPLPITEATPLAPDSWYAAAKVACEWIVAGAGDVKAKVTIARIPGIYGAATNDRSVVGRFVGQVRAGGRVVLRGAGRSLRDYVHADDVGAALVRLADVAPGGVVNVATGASVPLVDVARAVFDALGAPPSIELADGADDGRDFDLAFDVARLRAVAPGLVFRGLAAGIAGYVRPPADKSG